MNYVRMNFGVKSALAGLVASVGFCPISAFAEDACSCATAYHGPENPIGSIRHVVGDTMVSRSAGYEPAKAGNVLDFGSRVVVGPKGSASVKVGDCDLDVPANSSLEISRVENNICLKIQGPQQSAGGASGSVGGFGLPEDLFAGAVLTTGVLAATQNNNNGASR